MPTFVTTTNPIVDRIREILLGTDSRLSEYELIKSLADSAEDSFSYSFSVNGQPLNDKLVLFQRHFVVMNALYQLQGQFYSEGYFLTISPLEIYLQKIAPAADGGSVSKPVDHKLRDYYLDWDNLKQTTCDDVNKLLSSFWRGYLNNDQRIDALQLLELPVDADQRAIKTQYRRLIALHHPDKGGSPADFTRIRQAYEILLQNI